MNFDLNSLLTIVVIIVALVTALLSSLLFKSFVKKPILLFSLTGSLGLIAAVVVGPPITVQLLPSWINLDAPGDLVYAPKDLDSAKKYPLLLVLSPGGVPWQMMRVLRPVADKYKWILVGDREFRNGVDFELTTRSNVRTIEYALAHYPCDRQRVFSGGISGGAMGSYYLTYVRPDLIKGMIANTGMSPFASDPPCVDPWPDNFPKNKRIAMVASSTDFRYEAMKRNRIDLESRGWQVEWIEFVGGHNIAPVESFDKAFAFLSKQ